MRHPGPQVLRTFDTVQPLPVSFLCHSGDRHIDVQEPNALATRLYVASIGVPANVPAAYRASRGGLPQVNDAIPIRPLLVVQHVASPPRLFQPKGQASPNGYGRQTVQPIPYVVFLLRTGAR